MGYTLKPCLFLLFLTSIRCGLFCRERIPEAPKFLSRKMIPGTSCFPAGRTLSRRAITGADFDTHWDTDNEIRIIDKEHANGGRHFRTGVSRRHLTFILSGFTSATDVLRGVLQYRGFKCRKQRRDAVVKKMKTAVIFWSPSKTKPQGLLKALDRPRFTVDVLKSVWAFASRAHLLLNSAKWCTARPAWISTKCRPSVRVLTFSSASKGGTKTSLKVPSKCTLLVAACGNGSGERLIKDRTLLFHRLQVMTLKALGVLKKERSAVLDMQESSRLDNIGLKPTVSESSGIAGAYYLLDDGCVDFESLSKTKLTFLKPHLFPAMSHCRNFRRTYNDDLALIQKSSLREQSSAKLKKYIAEKEGDNVVQVAEISLSNIQGGLANFSITIRNGKNDNLETSHCISFALNLNKVGTQNLELNDHSEEDKAWALNNSENMSQRQTGKRLMPVDGDAGYGVLNSKNGIDLGHDANCSYTGVNASTKSGKGKGQETKDLGNSCVGGEQSLDNEIHGNSTKDAKCLFIVGAGSRGINELSPQLAVPKDIIGKNLKENKNNATSPKLTVANEAQSISGDTGKNLKGNKSNTLPNKLAVAKEAFGNTDKSLKENEKNALPSQLASKHAYGRSRNIRRKFKSKVLYSQPVVTKETLGSTDKGKEDNSLLPLQLRVNKDADYCSDNVPKDLERDTPFSRPDITKEECCTSANYPAENECKEPIQLGVTKEAHSSSDNIRKDLERDENRTLLSQLDVTKEACSTSDKIDELPPSTKALKTSGNSRKKLERNVNGTLHSEPDVTKEAHGSLGNTDKTALPPQLVLSQETHSNTGGNDSKKVKKNSRPSEEVVSKEAFCRSGNIPKKVKGNGDNVSLSRQDVTNGVYSSSGNVLNKHKRDEQTPQLVMTKGSSGDILKKNVSYELPPQLVVTKEVNSSSGSTDINLKDKSPGISPLSPAEEASSSSESTDKNVGSSEIKELHSSNSEFGESVQTKTHGLTRPNSSSVRAPKGKYVQEPSEKGKSYATRTVNSKINVPKVKEDELRVTAFSPVDARKIHVPQRRENAHQGLQKEFLQTSRPTKTEKERSGYSGSKPECAFECPVPNRKEFALDDVKKVSDRTNFPVQAFKKVSNKKGWEILLTGMEEKNVYDGGPTRTPKACAEDTNKVNMLNVSWTPQSSVLMFAPTKSAFTPHQKSSDVIHGLAPADSIPSKMAVYRKNEQIVTRSVELSSPKGDHTDLKIPLGSPRGKKKKKGNIKMKKFFPKKKKGIVKDVKVMVNEAKPIVNDSHLKTPITLKKESNLNDEISVQKGDQPQINTTETKHELITSKKLIHHSETILSKVVSKLSKNTDVQSAKKKENVPTEPVLTSELKKADKNTDFPKKEATISKTSAAREVAKPISKEVHINKQALDMLMSGLTAGEMNTCEELAATAGLRSAKRRGLDLAVSESKASSNKNSDKAAKHEKKRSKPAPKKAPKFFWNKIKKYSFEKAVMEQQGAALPQSSKLRIVKLSKGSPHHHPQATALTRQVFLNRSLGAANEKEAGGPISPHGPDKGEIKSNPAQKAKLLPVNAEKDHVKGGTPIKLFSNLYSSHPQHQQPKNHPEIHHRGISTKQGDLKDHLHNRVQPTLHPEMYASHPNIGNISSSAGDTLPKINPFLMKERPSLPLVTEMSDNPGGLLIGERTSEKASNARNLRPGNVITPKLMFQKSAKRGQAPSRRYQKSAKDSNFSLIRKTQLKKWEVLRSRQRSMASQPTVSVSEYFQQSNIQERNRLKTFRTPKPMIDPTSAEPVNTVRPKPVAELRKAKSYAVVEREMAKPEQTKNSYGRMIESFVKSIKKNISSAILEIKPKYFTTEKKT